MSAQKSYISTGGSGHNIKANQSQVW